MESHLQDSGSSFAMQGRFTYADYTPFEDGRNLVEIIREFAGLASKIGKIEVNNQKLQALASDSDRLRQDIIAAIKNIKTGTSQTMEKFHDEHSDVLSNDLLTKGSILLQETKRSLSELLSTTETGFDEQHARYRDKISSRIAENNATALGLIQAWLAADNANLPRQILLHLNTSVNASLNRKAGKGYEIIRRITSATADGAQGHPDSGALQFSYSFRIDPSELEFWNFRRAVAELGIKDLMLPIGMKAPVSEKIKQTFRFSKKDAEVMKEPEFERADGYFLKSASLQGDKTLTLELARDPARIDQGDMFRITYEVRSLSEPAQQGSGSGASANVPRLDYIPKQGEGEMETDLLQIPEIRSMAELSKIHLLGAAVLSRVRIIQDPQLIRSRGKLDELRVRSDVVVIPTAIESGQYDQLFDFLRAIARSYAPFVKKMKEKTAVSGELTLREELGGGQRKEYSVRINDLQSQLNETPGSKSVAEALGL
jgi:polyhydroxyalkanoate synthesis regulator phasin